MHLAHRTTQLAAAGPGGHCALKVDRDKEVVDDKVVDIWTPKKWWTKCTWPCRLLFSTRILQ